MSTYFLKSLRGGKQCSITILTNTISDILLQTQSSTSNKRRVSGAVHYSTTNQTLIISTLWNKIKIDNFVKYVLFQWFFLHSIMKNIGLILLFQIRILSKIVHYLFLCKNIYPYSTNKSALLGMFHHGFQLDWSNVFCTAYLCVFMLFISRLCPNSTMESWFNRMWILTTEDASQKLQFF